MHAPTLGEGGTKDTIPTWLYPCLYSRNTCYYLTIFKHNIIIITTTSLEKPHIIPPKTRVYNSLTLSFAKIVTPSYQSVVDTLKDARWYVTLTIVTTCI
jgi:hypothetical protein